MLDNVIGTGSTIGIGTDTSEKSYVVTSGPTNNVFTVPTHTIQTGEKVRIFSDDGDLPENLEENKVYFAIRDSDTQIKLASTLTNANNNTAITVYQSCNNQWCIYINQFKFWINKNKNIISYKKR